jgi:hypothetical protein
MTAQDRSYRRENVVRTYLLDLARRGMKNCRTQWETAADVCEAAGIKVTDRNTNLYWGAIFDLTQSGAVVVEPETDWPRLATPEELKARLTGEPASEEKIRLELILQGVDGKVRQ